MGMLNFSACPTKDPPSGVSREPPPPTSSLSSSPLSSSTGVQQEIGKKAAPMGLCEMGPDGPVSLHTLSAFLASSGSTFLFYPFDFLRTRFMSQDGSPHRQHNGMTYSSLRQSLRAVTRNEGVAALFRGCHLAMGGSAMAWGVYMATYRQLCHDTACTTYHGRFGLSLLASTAASLVSNPIFLIKSRMQLEEAEWRSAGGTRGRPGRAYDSFRTGVRQAVRTDGLRSLWRGMSLQLLLAFPHALGVPTYDALRTFTLRARNREPESAALHPIEIAACSGLSKLLVLCLSHPMMTVRVRLQDHRRGPDAPVYTSLIETLWLGLRRQGVGGFYRGFAASVLHTLPRGMVYFFIYEETLQLFCARRRANPSSRST